MPAAAPVGVDHRNVGIVAGLGEGREAGTDVLRHRIPDAKQPRRPDELGGPFTVGTDLLGRPLIL